MAFPRDLLPPSLLAALLLGAACASTPEVIREAPTPPSARGRDAASILEGGRSRLAADPEAMADALRPAPTRPWSSAAAYRHFLEGSVALEDGAYGKAERELSEAVLHDPESAHLHLSLARARWHAGKYEAARAAAAKAASLDPGLTEAHRLLARIHRELGALAEAEAALRRAIASAPEEIGAYVDLAALLLETGRVEEALQAYGSLEAEGPRDGAPWKTLGLALERAGHLHEARLAFVRARGATPEDAAAAEHEGRVCQALRERRCAVEAYGVALVLAEDRFHLHLRVARLFGELDDAESARASEEKLIAGDPSSADTLLQVALTAADRGELDLALRRLHRARTLAPRRGDLFYFEGYLRESRGEHEAALAAFERARKDPTHGADALLARAALLSRLGRYRAALEQLEALALRRSPEPPGLEARTLELETLARLGDAPALARAIARIPASQAHDIRVLAARANGALALGKPEEALRLLRAELRLRPRDQDLQYLLATVLLRQNRRDEALSLMEKVSAADPERADALNFLAYAWAETGERLADAETLVRRALTIEPTNGYILDTLGWVLLARGRAPEAVHELRRAARLLPVEAEVLEHLAEAHLKADQVDQAVATFRRLLALPDLPEPLRERAQARLEALIDP